MVAYSLLPSGADQREAEAADFWAGGYGFKSPFVQVDLEVPLDWQLNIRIRHVGKFELAQVWRYF